MPPERHPSRMDRAFNYRPLERRVDEQLVEACRGLSRLVNEIGRIKRIRRIQIFRANLKRRRESDQFVTRRKSVE